MAKNNYSADDAAKVTDDVTNQNSGQTAQTTNAVAESNASAEVATDEKVSVTEAVKEEVAAVVTEADAVGVTEQKSESEVVPTGKEGAE